MRKFLLFIYILQKQETTNKKRLNPFNPLSYLFLVTVFILGLLFFGFVGIWKEVDRKNPFKWQ